MAPSVSAWQSLQGSIGGEVALPGSESFDREPPVFNARYHDVRPQAIVRCATPEDVAATITFLSSHGLQHAIRGRGHSFGDYSSTRGVLIDTTPMRSVSVAGDVATVGAGARSGDVYAALDREGLAIPAGTCPPVGIAGLTLGGGLGILGRLHGVTSDLLLGAQIVLANGRIVECDENRHTDLFWALRGAGAGNFGVVTALVFRTVPAFPATNIHLSWRAADMARVIDRWQQWSPEAPDELAASLKVTASEGIEREPGVDVYAAHFGSESDAVELADELIRRVGREPASESRRHVSFAETRRLWADIDSWDGDGGEPPDETKERPYLFTKSEFFRRPLPAETIAALAENLVVGRVPGEARELDFMPWGGAYNRVRADATAFVHRSERFLLKHAATVSPRTPATRKEAAYRRVARSWEIVHPWASGRVFQNFADPDLDNWAEAYYGPNHDRLTRVKARYDEGNFFRFHQSVSVRR